MHGHRRIVGGLAAALLGAGLAAPAALADHDQPPRDIAQLTYSPEGHFKAGGKVPLNVCDETFLGQVTKDPGEAQGRFNPSGSYNAFDTNIFETICLPFRASGDTTVDDPYGNGGDPRHGYCAQPSDPAARPGNPAYLPGVCPNHALEYADYFEATMKDILGDFGVSMRRYGFEVPDPELPLLDNTLGGHAINTAAVVPGVDHPDHTVIVSGHFDQTNDGPASAWDSAEGHAQVIRVAKLMADYWNSTGTRPSATVKFVPWAAEEAGTLGSKDYAENNIVPGEEHEVRGYWNTDPCAGGYPAYRFGNPADRVAMGIQLARPEEIPGEFDKQRVINFNAGAPDIVEQVLDHLDDTVTTRDGARRDVFISKSETAEGGEHAGQQPDTRAGGPLTIGDSRPVLFSSDWRNFLAKGVPFFNPGPEVTGPSDENEPNNPDGIAILHTPNDNLVTLNRYTGDATGENWSEGWMKGMELCSQLLAWGMLRADQGGAQTDNDDLVAYYEALPNEAKAGEAVTFDAGGSHQRGVDAGALRFEWDFGDGTAGSGRTVDHAYTEKGVYASKLTVVNTQTGARDTMSVPITVIGQDIAGPQLTAPAEDQDGTFELTWTFDQAAPPGFSRYAVEEATDFRTPLNDPAEDLAAGWTASEPTEPVIQPWQHSDDASGSVRGNVKHSGERSFYTGVDRADQRPGVGPDTGVSMLTRNEPVTLGQDAELTYRSSYANDRNDTSRVEVAVDGSEDWRVVDRVTTSNYFNVPTDEVLYPKGMELRRADLSQFAGQSVRIRFVYSLGSSQYINVFRTGWYVDDLRIDTGTFQKIAETTLTTHTVTERPAGDYAYRIRAVYEDGVRSRPSNTAPVTVTEGPPAGAGKGKGKGPKKPRGPKR